MACVHGGYKTQEVVEMAADVSHRGGHETTEGCVVSHDGGRRVVAEPEGGVGRGRRVGFRGTNQGL